MAWQAELPEVRMRSQHHVAKGAMGCTKPSAGLQKKMSIT